MRTERRAPAAPLFRARRRTSHFACEHAKCNVVRGRGEDGGRAARFASPLSPTLRTLSLASLPASVYCPNILFNRAANRGPFPSSSCFKKTYASLHDCARSRAAHAARSASS